MCRSRWFRTASTAAESWGSSVFRKLRSLWSASTNSLGHSQSGKLRRALCFQPVVFYCLINLRRLHACALSVARNAFDTKAFHKKSSRVLQSSKNICWRQVLIQLSKNLNLFEWYFIYFELTNWHLLTFTVFYEFDYEILLPHGCCICFIRFWFDECDNLIDFVVSLVQTRKKWSLAGRRLWWRRPPPATSNATSTTATRTSPTRTAPATVGVALCRGKKPTCQSAATSRRTASRSPPSKQW